MVLAHSVAGELLTLAVSNAAVYRWATPHLPVDVAGTGDVLMALLIGFLLRDVPFEQAVGHALSGVHSALEATLSAGYEEFDVLAAAPAALAGAPRFALERLA